MLVLRHFGLVSFLDGLPGLQSTVSTVRGSQICGAKDACGSAGARAGCATF